jgi:HSP20 family protein
MTDFGPYLEFVRIQTEMNSLFESLQELRAPKSSADKGGGAWVPNVDICECGDALIVEAEMPGVDPDSLVVKVGGGNIVLEGVKLRPDIKPEEVHRKDRIFGTFRRVVPLSAPVNTHRAEAVLKGGLLRVRFPRVANKRGEAIPIPVQKEGE